MSIITTEQAIPTGTWRLDPVHSTVGYAVRHSGVSLFKGTVDSFDAELAGGALRGSADVSSITVNDENLQGHLLSPDFFDVERAPQVFFGLTLETVIDRTSFGMNWNMELPGGGFVLDNEVTLIANLELGKALA